MSESVRETNASGFSVPSGKQCDNTVPLDEKSNNLVMVNTHRGLFRYTGLPIGIALAPGVFQKIMENLLWHMPGVMVYIDNIYW